jgi:hypothetical protein
MCILEEEESEEVYLCWDYGYDREEVVSALYRERYDRENLTTKEIRMLKQYHAKEFYI